MSAPTWGELWRYFKAVWRSNHTHWKHCEGCKTLEAWKCLRVSHKRWIWLCEDCHAFEEIERKAEDQKTLERRLKAEARSSLMYVPPGLYIDGLHVSHCDVGITFENIVIHG
jgi:hypothetical protein